MLDMQVTLELLFEQLGLDASTEAIDQFIEQHQLAQNTPLHHAAFWTDAQRNFLISHWKKDDEWAMVVDNLNTLLHQHDGVSNTKV